LRRYVTAPAPRRPEPARLADASVASVILKDSGERGKGQDLRSVYEALNASR
jgi:hypothetical protein